MEIVNPITFIDRLVKKNELAPNANTKLTPRP
jgi:hypothetical protein